MRFSKQVFVLVVVTIALAVSLPPVSASVGKEESQILDAYKCIGVSPKGEKYTLSLEVKRTGDNYHLAWMDKEKFGQVALGIRTGDILSVSIFDLKQEEDGKIRLIPGGVGAYAVESSTLKGKWAFGDGNVYTETCGQAKSISAN